MNKNKSIKIRYPKIPKIAILEPDIFSCATEMQWGLVNNIAALHHYMSTFRIFNAFGVAEKIPSLVDEVIDEGFHVIIPVGTTCTKEAYRGTIRRKRYLPIVFCAASKPEVARLVHSMQPCANHITGFAGTNVNHKLQTEYLLQVQPKIKKIVLLYQKPCSVISNINLVERQIRSARPEGMLEVQSLAVSDKSELITKVPAAVINADAVIVTRDYILLSKIRMLMGLCDQLGVILCTCDLESVKQGATVGFGPHDYKTGAQVARGVVSLMHNNLHPSQVPIKTMRFDYKFMVNTAMLQRHNIPFEATVNKVAALKNGILV